MRRFFDENRLVIGFCIGVLWGTLVMAAIR